MPDIFDDLLRAVESELHVARRNLEDRIGPIRAALDSYERAVLEQRTEEYCQAHSLRRPKTAGIPPSAAAQALLTCVRALPELKPSETQSKDAAQEDPTRLASAAVTTAAAVTSPAAVTSSTKEPSTGAEDPVATAFAQKFPHLTRAAEGGRLLVFGAFSGRTKQLPAPLHDVTEWIDTASDGNLLVAAATRRITSGAVFAIIVCEKAIAHQHSDPVTRAARNKQIPIAYAGKGGTGSLARALEALESSLGS